MSSAANQVMGGFAEEALPCNNKPLDLVHLSRQTFGNKDLENEVLGLFKCHSVQYIDRLKTATTEKEWTDILHTIKGSARAVGAWKTGDLCEQYEQRISSMDEEMKSKAIVEIEANINHTISYIMELI